MYMEYIHDLHVVFLRTGILPVGDVNLTVDHFD
jgi:hypothetical protein